MGMGKLPWFKFFPTDWRADVGLKLCSLAARGLWLEMICIMHEAGGYLEINGSPVSTPALAALSGTSPQEISALLGELEEAGVFSRDRKGRLYSRRMLRDLKKASTARNNGRKGGNPKLVAKFEEGPSPSQQRRKPAKVKPDVKPNDNRWDKAQKPDARVQTLSKTPKGVKTGGPFTVHGARKEMGEFEGEESDNCELLVNYEVGELTELMRDSLTGESQQPATSFPEAEPQMNSTPFQKKSLKGTRLEEEWEPGERDIEFARQRGLEEESIATEALKFRNYWTSLGGRKACKLDWHRTWQNLILRGFETQPISNNGPIFNNGAQGGSSLGGGGARGRFARGQRPRGLELAEIGARVLGRAQAQDDFPEERGQPFASGGGDFASGDLD